MNNQSTAPKSLNSQNKDTHFEDQFRKVYQAFFDEPKTMKEADKLTGVMRENICWYCRTLRQQNRLYVIGKRLCKVTKHVAKVWTTNPELIPVNQQLTLF